MSTRVELERKLDYLPLPERKVLMQLLQEGPTLAATHTTTNKGNNWRVPAPRPEVLQNVAYQLAGEVLRG